MPWLKLTDDAFQREENQELGLEGYLVLQEALNMHRRGATHDCGEWGKDGRCRLCGKEL